ncbi:MAG: ParB/RepB/Spo0J family partition protein [Fimbriimonadaceae bacterium]|nr:ParB/RepB/Spo0J family partition protein [Fimbriimonadaceae bacterium]
MRRALGKGLSQLIGEQTDPTTAEAPLDAIVPNSRQPRTHFDDTALEELAASIREVGVLQPLLVRPLSEGRYELIAGERRLRAAQMAGLKTVPIVVRSAGAKTSLELALIENVQREDISALECAKAYQQLVAEFGLTQEQIADRVGKSRPAIANTLRLLRLPKRILEGLEKGTISEGHARALLQLDNDAQRLAVFDQVVSRGLSVRQTEEASRPKTATKPRKKAAELADVDPSWRAVREALSERLGTPVRLTGDERGGSIVVPFYSEEDLSRLCDVLGIEL